MADTPAVTNTPSEADAPPSAPDPITRSRALATDATPRFIGPFVPDDRAIALIPRDHAIYGLLPLWLCDGVLGVGTIEEEKYQSLVRHTLAQLKIHHYELFLMEEPELKAGLRTAYPLRQARIGDAVGVRDPNDPNQLLERVFEEAHQARASDIHLNSFAGGESGGYALRVDGMREPAQPFPANTYRALVNVTMTRFGMDHTNQRVPHDGRYKWPKFDLEMRAASMPVLDDSQAITIRLFPELNIPTLEQIGMSDQVRRIHLNAANSAYGAIFITGPTGSGKTTTLYSTITSIDYIHRKIVTIEDPVEKRLTQYAVQTGVSEGAGLTFASYLKNLVRHDPNVVMVGEIRDPDAAQAGINASLIGLLMLTTLHAPDALRTITRLIELGVAPGTLSDAGSLFVAQRLLRVLCDECKRAEATPQSMLLEYPNAPTHVFAASGTDASGAKCPACNGRGYKGRIGVFEIVVNTPEVARAIRAQVSAVDLRAVAANDGYRPMRFDAMDRVAAGITSWSEVERVLLSERLPG